MFTTDLSTLTVFLLAAAVVAVLIGTLPDWRRFAHEGWDLPIWGFLWRGGLTRGDIELRLGVRAARQAELRCAACGARAQCERVLAEGGSAPAGQCPNGYLLRASGIGAQASGLTNASRSEGPRPAA